uniref:Uncharacterized protein n=1 Tax=Vespula pensylvanica TaxID=30213 RepID=A0A834K5M7_VESPE|nr:hypothetical protein H0235_015604 [Vespula pensylvanica]
MGKGLPRKLFLNRSDVSPGHPPALGHGPSRIKRHVMAERGATGEGKRREEEEGGEEEEEEEAEAEEEEEEEEYCGTKETRRKRRRWRREREERGNGGRREEGGAAAVAAWKEREGKRRGGGAKPSAQNRAHKPRAKPCASCGSEGGQREGVTFSGGPAGASPGPSCGGALEPQLGYQKRRN